MFTSTGMHAHFNIHLVLVTKFGFVLYTYTTDYHAQIESVPCVHVGMLSISCMHDTHCLHVYTLYVW